MLCWYTALAQVWTVTHSFVNTKSCRVFVADFQPSFCWENILNKPMFHQRYKLVKITVSYKTSLNWQSLWVCRRVRILVWSRFLASGYSNFYYIPRVCIYKRAVIITETGHFGCLQDCTSANIHRYHFVLIVIYKYINPFVYLRLCMLINEPITIQCTSWCS